MKCPHCLVEINPDFTEKPDLKDSISDVSIFYMKCPNSNCSKIIIDFARGKSYRTTYKNSSSSPLLDSNTITERKTIYPLVSSRPPAPIVVDKHIAQDYNESSMVLNFSPKASAALSRRCLQNILREKAGVKHGNLVNEIKEAITNGLPSYIAESIDAIRTVGNFAAHPMKDTATGAIVDVEVGEAEWLLDVLELLFDFYYVQPDIAKKKKADLDAKLASVGKASMK